MEAPLAVAMVLASALNLNLSSAPFDKNKGRDIRLPSDETNLPEFVVYSGRGHTADPAAPWTLITLAEPLPERLDSEDQASASKTKHGSLAFTLVRQATYEPLPRA